MDYIEVSKAQQEQILKQRIAGWESDHWGHQINLLAGQANNDQQTIDVSNSALKVLEASITAARGLLNDNTANTTNPASGVESAPTVGQ